MAYRRLILIILFLILLVPCISAAEYPYRVFFETPVVTADQSWVPGSFKISPDGRRYAYIKLDEGQQRVILDGKADQSYQAVVDLFFSPDSNHFAYIAQQNNQYFLVYDGAAGKPYDGISAGSFSFSPDSEHYVFIGKTGDKWLVATEAGGGKTYDEIDPALLGFSPDSQSLAYIARLGDKWFAVINGQESQAFDKIQSLIFSPDSKRVALIARVGNGSAVIIDNETGPAFSMVKPGSLVFSHDSQRIGYIAADQGREFVVINQQAGKAYDQIISERIVFAPDNEKIAYAAQLQENQFMVVDGVEGKPYQQITEAPPVFSPDGQKIAYIASNGTDWMVVLDGVEQTGYASIGKGSLLFSKRGSRLAYTAKTIDGKWTVVVDGVAGRYYDGIGHNSLTFSPDGKNVVYSARQGAKWLVVLDNQEGRLFDGIVSGSGQQIKFNDSAFFHYSALDGLKIVNVRERIPSKSDFKELDQTATAQPETDLPPDLLAQEFEFQFNPPNGLRFIETTKTVDQVEADVVNQSLHEEEIKIQTEVTKSDSGFQMNYLILKYQVNDVEDQAGGEALSALEGVKFTVFLNTNGFITGFKGLEDFEKKLKSIPARHYRKYKDYFSKEAVEKRLRDHWKTAVENFIGKRVKMGDVWKNSAKVPLPNGEVGDFATDVTFKETTFVGSLLCVVIQIDYDLNSSNLKKFISEMIKKGIPQLQTEPEVNISSSGESIVDPRTMLAYSSRMEMVMKATVDIPNLGKKEFTYKRLVNNDCEYSN